jgi:hypothetical protein
MLRITDADLMSVGTTLTADIIEMNFAFFVELGLYQDIDLPGEGIYLNRTNARKLRDFLTKYLEM